MKCQLQSVAVEQLELLRIPEIPCSKLDQAPGYPEKGFPMFTSVPTGHYWNGTSSYDTTVSFQIVYNSLIIQLFAHTLYI
jgi:hypothetical protein